MKGPFLRGLAFVVTAVLAVLCAAAVRADDRPPGSLPGDRGAMIVETAMKHLGARYRYGGTGNGGFDCSGFAMAMYGKFGIHLKHAADRQYLDGTKIGAGELQPGDLVFYRIYRNRISHVGIYTGNGKFIHAPRWGHVVSVTDMNLPYWRYRYAGAATYLRKKPELKIADLTLPAGKKALVKGPMALK